jgi:hypothetical protein
MPTKKTVTVFGLPTLRPLLGSMPGGGVLGRIDGLPDILQTRRRWCALLGLRRLHRPRKETDCQNERDSRAKRHVRRRGQVCRHGYMFVDQRKL